MELGTTKYRTVTVYRPPSSTEDQDRDLYNQLNQLTEGRVSIVMGDFNTHVDWATRETRIDNIRLLNFVNEGFFTQWVREPTRGANILDLVLTSEDDIIEEVSVDEELGGSDHRLIRFCIRVPAREAVARAAAKLNFRKANFAGLRAGVAAIEVEDSDNVEQPWKNFKNSFMALQSRFIPSERGRVGATQPKWFTPEIGRTLRKRKTAYRQAKNTGEFEHYKSLCRSVKSMIRVAKRAEEVRVARLCKESPKEFFGYVNSRKPTRRRIGPLVKEDGELELSDEANATILNKYFSSVFTEEKDTTPEPRDKYEGSEQLERFHFEETTVRSKIDALNRYKSPGPDGFLPRVLKEVRDEVSPHLCSIFRKSLETGCVPKDWRDAEVTPIFKKGNASEPSNYRPISLTSVVGKLMESILVDKITQHVESNHLLRNSQHGFRRHRSCLTNLLEFFHFVFSEHDREKAVDVIYLDLKKAFDKVPHRRLLKKVRALGIAGAVGDWIENWLHSRRQRVVVNGQKSGWLPVTSGVPQGSVLGPLLFIIYVNDIDDGITARISKFADDTKLGMNVADAENVERLQADLRKLGEWSDKWQMPFNVEKCKVMHIGHRNPQAVYSLKNSALESTDMEKDLGVVITSDLKFSKQCIEAEKKAQRILGYIKRQFGYRNREIVLTLFNSLVRPHLEYAVQFWSPSLRKDIARLERVQARATKLIPSIRHKSYEARLEELNLFSLETRRRRGQLIEVFKILRGIDHVGNGDMFQLSEGVTRNHGYKIELPRYHRDRCGNFFSYSICNEWNALPPEVVNSDSVEQFKRRLDKVLVR